MSKNIKQINIDNTAFDFRPYGTCSTVAGTAAKVVSISDFNLFTGATVLVKFENNNTAPFPTLNINNTGAKSIIGGNLTSGGIYEFMYDGTYWNIIKSDSSKNYHAIDLTSLSQTNFYPVIFNAKHYVNDCEIHSPNVSGTSSYNQNILHFQLHACGYSDTPKSFKVLSYGTYSNLEITIGAVGYGNTSGEHCVWVRGGMKYEFICNIKPVLYANGYSNNEQVFMSGVNYYGGTNEKVTICWSADNPRSEVLSEAATSTKLGGIKTGYTQSGKNYPVQLDSNNKAYVNVPWSGYTHPTSGVTEGSYGLSANATPSHGTTFNVPYITVNATGHVTAASTNTVTLPTYSAATSSAAGLMSATDKQKLDSLIKIGTANTNSLGGILAAGVRGSNITTTQGSTTENRYYGVEVDSTGKAFVNVPWTDTNTDTKVTSVSNHYTPSENTSSAIAASNGTLTDIANSSVGVQVVTGLKRDAAGHVVGVNSIALKATNSTYTLSTATTTTLGGIKIGKDNSNYTVAAATSNISTNITSGTGKYYSVEIDKNGKAFVYVPWTDTDTKVTSVSNHYTPSENTSSAIAASNGTLTDIANSSVGVQVVTGLKRDAAGHVVGVNSIALKATNSIYALPTATTATLGGIKIGKDNLNYTVAAATSSISTNITSGKYYAVEIDKNDKAFVYVPWTDNYTLPTSASSSTAYSTNTLSKDKITELTSTALTNIAINGFETASTSRLTTYGLIFNATTSTTFTWPSDVKWANGKAPCIRGDKIGEGLYEIIFTYTPNIKKYTATWAKYS